MFAIFVLLIVSSPPEAKTERYILSYEPKHCFTSPCPQYRVEKVDQKIRGDFGADLLSQETGKEFDAVKAGLEATSCLQVDGVARDPSKPAAKKSMKKKGQYRKIYYRKDPLILKEKAPCHP